MATKAQCFYCFECLSASFENRNTPSLSTVTALWQDYETSRLMGQEPGLEAAGNEGHDSMSAPEDVEGEEKGLEPEVDDEEDEEDEEEEESSRENVSNVSNTPSNNLSPDPTSRPQIPSISRLRSSNRSSGASTPSTDSTSTSLSASSSNSALTTPASSTASIPHNFSKTLLQRHRAPVPPSSYPLFVTWSTHSARSNHKSLRGCIGTFDALPLASGLQSYALTSAFEDTRFSPIPASQLPSLSCAITLLAEFETCTTPLDWTVGTHGLRVNFVHRGRRMGATYLPDVAMEQGWSREETLESLMRKAGWDGGNGGGGVRRLLRGGRREGLEGGAGAKPWEEVASFTAVRYTGLKASVGYREWKEWKDWVEMRDSRALLG